MATAVISRWARRFVLVAVASLVLAQLAALSGLPHRAEIVLGLYGFVLTVAFGKAYSLVPSYFDRTLAFPHAPSVHLPLHALAIGCLAVAPFAVTPGWLGALGTLAWSGGIAVLVGSIGVTIASNPLGRETGTSAANQERAWLDRLANPFMPVAMLYLLAGSYGLLAGTTPLPQLLDGSPVRLSHLFGAGFALLLLFAVGYRLLPRFLVATPPRALAVVVLPAGAIGPALLAVGYPAGVLFTLGAALEAIAVCGFAVSYGWLFVRTDRDRVGFYGPLLGVVAGLGGVALGVWFATVGFSPALVAAHWRLNVFGLLGLSIAGVLLQFYPPAVAAWPLAGDQLAFATLLVFGVGVAGLGLDPAFGARLAVIGHGLMALAGLLLGYLLAGTIWTQTAGRGS